MSVTPVQPFPVSGLGPAAASLADFAPQSILALAAEPQRAVAVLIEPVEEIYRMVGWQTVDLPAQTGPRRLRRGPRPGCHPIGKAVQHLALGCGTGPPPPARDRYCLRGRCRPSLRGRGFDATSAGMDGRTVRRGGVLLPVRRRWPARFAARLPPICPVPTKARAHWQGNCGRFVPT